MFTPPLEGSRPPLGKILDPPLLAVTHLKALVHIHVGVWEKDANYYVDHIPKVNYLKTVRYFCIYKCTGLYIVRVKRERDSFGICPNMPRQSPNTPHPSPPPNGRTQLPPSLNEAPKIPKDQELCSNKNIYRIGVLLCN